jgi:hypothetical protein
MDRMHVRVAALALLVWAGACDSATDVVGDLSRAEAEALAEVVGSSVMNGAMVASPGGDAGPQRAIVNYDEAVSLTAECELGGTVAVEGSLGASIDDEIGEGVVEFTLTQVHDGCTAESEDGVVFTLDGAPSVTSDLRMEFSEQVFTLDGSYTGAVDWSTEGREGRCSVDVEFSADLNGLSESGSVSMSGTVCGVQFSKSLTAQ